LFDGTASHIEAADTFKTALTESAWVKPFSTAQLGSAGVVTSQKLGFFAGCGFLEGLRYDNAFASKFIQTEADNGDGIKGKIILDSLAREPAMMTVTRLNVELARSTIEAIEWR